MKQIIIAFFLLTVSVQALDKCIQYTNYKQCIAVDDAQCKWDSILNKCAFSDNYLYGCQSNLSVQLCVKQFGLITGEIGICIFLNHCQTIPDLDQVQCVNKVNKGGCLAITNQNQLCKWSQGQCLNLTTEEMNQIQTNFMDLELSASVCPLINGYLILHHSVLWSLVSYTPDLVTEAENLVKEEAGIAVSTTNSYDSGTLQNNYVDDSGYFKWYQIKSTKSNIITNLKINDKTRYGCIAQEILSDSNFLEIFSLTGTIRSVNHIYCKYLNRHPNNPRFTIFYNNKCIPVTAPQLRDSKFLASFSGLKCQSMGPSTCQRLQHQTLKCQLLVQTTSAEFEYSCIDQTHVDDNSSCNPYIGFSTYFNCQFGNQCFLNLQNQQGYCDDTCGYQTIQSDCAIFPQCQWLSQYLQCVPSGGCSNLGIGEIYCKKLNLTCYWDEIQKLCIDAPDLARMKCTQANTLFTCSQISLQDQQCIWLNDECINSLDQPLFSHFKAIPTDIKMNRNQCLHQEGDYFYYDSNNLVCVDSYYISIPCLDSNTNNINNQPCNYKYTPNISKSFCLNMISTYTRWDQFRLICLNITLDYIATIQCSDLKLVNAQVCSKAQVTDSTNYYCFYDKINQQCYLSQKTTELTCDQGGLDENLCKSIKTYGQFCQFLHGRCQTMTYSLIQQYQCIQLTRINPRVCSVLNTTEKCYYLADQNICAPSFIAQSSCDYSLNPKACQQSASSCYYDFVHLECKDTTTVVLSKIKCESMYLSKLACIDVSTPGQACYWDPVKELCRLYVSFYAMTCTQFTNMNSQSCTKISTLFTNQLVAASYCEFVDNVCVAKNEQITDCGSDKLINIHRCNAYTTGNCYWNSDSLTCTLLGGTTQYQEYMLKQITCNQANLNLCWQIQTVGQICNVINNVTDMKCSNVALTTSNTCANLKSTYIFDGSQTTINSNICQVASDSCLYNSTTKKCDSLELTVQYPCNYPGLSKSACLAQTYGQCSNPSQTCIYITDQTTVCKYRNKSACLQNNLNCIWDSSLNICDVYYLTCATYISSNLIIGWQSCGYSNGDCYPSQGKCATVRILNLPCWLSLSYDLCLAQSHKCNWLDSQCVEYSVEYCSNAKTQSDCVNNQNPQQKCVYHNNQCFQPTSMDIPCNIFDYTSHQFCRQYEECVYTSTYKCVNKMSTKLSKQIDTANLYGYSCSGFYTQNDCTYQRSQKCTYIQTPSSACIASTINACTQIYDEVYSILTCEQFDNCYFATTTTGQGFCYEGTLDCTVLNSSFCLKDIFGLACHYDGSQCVSNTFTSCSEIQDKKVNRQACLSVDPTGANCVYNSANALCKLTRRTSVSLCASATNLHDCTFAYELNCLINFSPISCADGIATHQNTASQSNNFYGCTQLATGMTYFDLSLFTCVQLPSTGTIHDNFSLIYPITICRIQNQNLCLQFSGSLNLSCYWNTTTKQCAQALDSDLTTITCSQMNQLLCRSSTNHPCVWKDNACSLFNDIVITDCSTTSLNCQFSPSYCLTLSSSDLYLRDTNYQCYLYPTPYPIYFPQTSCEILGLNKSTCLNNTAQLKCYWNGTYCKTTNLEVQTCSEDLSKQSCLSINTLFQNCYWDSTLNKCLNQTANNCESYNGLRLGCIKLNLPCFYEEAVQQCQTTTQSFEKCESQLSKYNCIHVINQTCRFDGYKCANWTPEYYTCTQIVNKYGCLYSPMVCLWSDSTGCSNYIDLVPRLCKDLPPGLNKIGCSTYSIDSCTFDETTELCTYELRASEIVSIETYSQEGYTQPLLTESCSYFTELKDCVGSRKESQKCEWAGSFCKVSDLQSCINQNLWACLANISQLCAWRDNQCVAWVAPNNPTLSQITLVSMGVCQTLPDYLYAKYDTYSCTTTDIAVANCNTPGINKNTCVSLQAYNCQYKNGFCGDFISLSTQICSDYINVTQSVCSQILGLKCKYDKSINSCAASTNTDTCTTPGLSKFACLSITTEACEWDGSNCNLFIPDNSKNQCDSQTLRNLLSCALMDYIQLPCVYDSMYYVCSQKINRLSLCSVPGLNKYGCFSIIREPCQFINNSCSRFYGIEQKCFQTQNVNAAACSILTLDACAYNAITFSCQSTLFNVPCSLDGLNKVGCSQTSYCDWNYDDSQCICNSLQHIDYCQVSEDSCIASDFCAYENGQCIKKQCEHLAQCTGYINGKQCYLNQDGFCQGALTCEDIVHLNPEQGCSSFHFSGSSCLQGRSYCVSSTNFEEVCLNSDCTSSKCKMSQGLCRELRCSDLSIKTCYDLENCAVIDDLCQEITNCSQITDETKCPLTWLNGMQCSWQEYSVMDSTKWCTNNYCSIFGASSTLCTGNEINDHTCSLSYSLQCKICEQITDMCECNNSKNSCYYSNGTCKSMQCGNFYNTDTCSASYRCYWSSTDQVCRKMCVQLLRQEECEALTYECHWNKYKLICVQGKEEEVDLSVKIQVQDIYAVRVILIILNVVVMM